MKFFQTSHRNESYLGTFTSPNLGNPSKPSITLTPPPLEKPIDFEEELENSRSADLAQFYDYPVIVKSFSEDSESRSVSERSVASTARFWKFFGSSSKIRSLGRNAEKEGYGKVAQSEKSVIEGQSNVEATIPKKRSFKQLLAESVTDVIFINAMMDYPLAYVVTNPR